MEKKDKTIVVFKNDKAEDKAATPASEAIEQKTPEVKAVIDDAVVAEEQSEVVDAVVAEEQPEVVDAVVAEEQPEVVDAVVAEEQPVELEASASEAVDKAAEPEASASEAVDKAAEPEASASEAVDKAAEPEASASEAVDKAAESEASELPGTDFVLVDAQGDDTPQQNVIEVEAEPVHEGDIPSGDFSNRAYGSNAGSAANAAEKGSKKKASKSADSASQFVTKKFMVICLAISIVVSAALGAGLSAVFLNTGGSSKSHSNLSESDLSSATGSSLTIAEIIEKNADAVVEIVVSGTTVNMFGQSQISEGAGSGVIVNSKGYIVTNYHVISGANKVQVTLHNGNSYTAQIVGGDKDNDIAVIKINASNLTVATLGDSSTLQVGDLAVAIGNPLGQLGGTATSGIVSALNRRLTIEDTTLDLIQTDAAINAGNSGGGLFNGAGELIGIVDAKSSGTGIEGLAFAIPINSVKDIINELIETGKTSGKPAIGVSIYDVSEENAQYYNLDGAGVYINEVTGDNAKKAGFQSGDRVISINGKKITSSSDMISRVRQNKIGDTITVVVSRDGQEISIKTVLEESVSSSSSQSSNNSQGNQGNQGGQSLDDYLEQFGF